MSWSNVLATTNRKALGWTKRIRDNSHNGEGSSLRTGKLQDPSAGATTANMSITPHHEYQISNKSVKLYVGPEKKLWIFNENLLCDRVPYFRIAFQGPFKEGKEKTMELPEDDAIAFTKLADWLHNGLLQCPDCRQSWHSPFDNIPPRDRAKLPDHELLWASVWVLADKLDIPDLATATLRRLETCLSYRRHIREDPVISTKVIEYVYANTMAGSSLREVIVKQIASYHFSTEKSHNTRLTGLLGGDEDVQADLLEQIRRHVGTSCCCWNLLFPWDGRFSCYYHHNLQEEMREEARRKERHRRAWVNG